MLAVLVSQLTTVGLSVLVSMVVRLSRDAVGVVVHVVSQSTERRKSRSKFECGTPIVRAPPRIASLLEALTCRHNHLDSSFHISTHRHVYVVTR